MWCLTLSGCRCPSKLLCSLLLSWAGERKYNQKSRCSQGELTEQLPSQGRQRDPKILPRKLNTEKNCHKNCTCWWQKYHCGFSVGKSSGVSIIAFPGELHPGSALPCVSSALAVIERKEGREIKCYGKQKWSGAEL